MKPIHLGVFFLVALMIVSLGATAYATPDMSRDGRSCYSSECHAYGTVDEELNAILEQLGDTINDPDPSDVSYVYEGTEPGGGTYTPGVYTAEDRGEGKLTVTMTFTEDTITEIQIVGKKETPSIGGYAEVALAQAIIEAQSTAIVLTDVDATTGATVTSSAVIRAATNCIAQAMGMEPSELEAIIAEQLAEQQLAGE